MGKVVLVCGKGMPNYWKIIGEWKEMPEYWMCESSIPPEEMAKGVIYVKR